MRENLGIYDPAASSAYVRRFEREAAQRHWRPVREAYALRALKGRRAVLVGEYHPLPGACAVAETLIRAWRAAAPVRPLTLALEMVYASDQALLDAFQDRRIGERLFLERTRHATDWGYPWRPVARLLRAARDHGVRCLALDIAPRGSASALGLRDRIFADRISAELGRSAHGRVLAIVGEAHLATDCLPRRLEATSGLSAGRVFADVELQGVLPATKETTPWLRAEEGVLGYRPRAPGRRVAALARTYRRWASEAPDPAGSDRAMMAYSLMDALASAAGLDPRRTRLGPGRWLADHRPMVWGVEQEPSLRHWARAEGVGQETVSSLLARARRTGAAWSAPKNLLLISARGLAALPLACARALVDGARDARLPSRGAGAEAASPTDGRLDPGPETAPGGSAPGRNAPNGHRREMPGLDWREVAGEALAMLLARHADPRLGAPALGEAPIEEVLGAWLGDALSARVAAGAIPPSLLRRWLRRPPRTPAAGLLRMRAMVRACGSRAGRSPV